MGVTRHFDVTEFWGTGDPFFGGTADDRPLGKSGAFLTGSWNRSQIANFATANEALAAAAQAPNRRIGATLSAAPFVPLPV